MSKEWKAKRAEQARARRKKQKKRLKDLEQQANAEGATVDIKAEFSDALEKRELVRKYNKNRMAKSRNKHKRDVAKGNSSALEKADKQKKVRQLLYLKYKSSNKVKLRKALYRSRKRFDIIKSKLEIEDKDINSRFMDFRRSKITPLGAAVRYCDLGAVRYMLENKASPTLRCISTLICTPLYDAAWMGKSQIAELLLEKSALPEDGASGGALHGAIYNKMFKVIRIMLNQGCQVNEYYLDQTPLGAALTCGKKNSGDVRLVRRLLAAKADLMKKTKMSHSPFFKGRMVLHTHVAREYSSKRCRAVLKA